jgi:undecaprenyl-diphosphatase
LYKIPNIISGEQPIGEIFPIVVGVLIAFIIGLLTIHFFLKVIQNLGFGVFAIYRILLGIIVLSIL